jgi:hypothetical protein
LDGVGRMKDTLIVRDILHPPQKIRIETPIGSIETMDDRPMIDGLIIILVFFSFCFFVYAKYFGNKK